MLDDFGLLGEGPLPGNVHVPGHIETVGDKLVWSWLHPETEDPYQGATDFGKLLPIISEIPVGTDCTDWPLVGFLQSARPHYTDPRGMLNAFTRINKPRMSQGSPAGTVCSACVAMAFQTLTILNAEANKKTLQDGIQVIPSHWTAGSSTSIWPARFLAQPPHSIRAEMPVNGSGRRYTLPRAELDQ